MNEPTDSKVAPTLVRIYGTDYPVRSQADPEHVRRVGEAVDQEMRRLSKNQVVKSTAELAVLAAMHLADELLRTQEELRDVLDRVGATTDAMEEILDEGSSSPVSERP